MKNVYRTVPVKATLQDLITWAIDVTRNRQFDFDDYELQVAQNPKIFPVPASSSSLIGTEKVGDIAVDASYLYYVCDNAGTLEWRRIASSTF